MPEALHRCVQHVMAQGHDERSAYAICQAAMSGKAHDGDLAAFIDSEKYAQIQAFVDGLEKAGARHSDRDRGIIATIHDKAHEIQQAALDLGHVLPDPGVQYIGKAGGLPDAAEAPVIFGVVKAAGDWELDVLANPYGGPNNGRDTDGQYFSPRTHFHEDQIPNPPAVYYHGYDKDASGKAVPMGLPEWIGRAVKRWTDSRGVWYRIVLNSANQYAKRVWEAAKRGVARASSGVVLASHRVDENTGEILSWLNGEISLFETDSGKRPANSYAVALPALKAVFKQAGLVLPDFTAPQTDATGPNTPAAVARGQYPKPKATEKSKMTPEEMQQAAEAQLAAEREAQARADAEAQEKFNQAYRAGVEKAEREAAARIAAAEKRATESGRLPMGTPDEPGQAPYQTKFAGTRKFDGLTVDDMGYMLTLLSTAKKRDQQHPGYSPDALWAYAIKCAEDKTVIRRRDGRTDVPLGDQGRAALKAAGIDPSAVLKGAIKSDELNRSTLGSYGDDWIGVEYSSRLWESIRMATFVLDKMPSVEVPQGAESIVISIESTDPVWYKVAQTTDVDTTDLRPVATVTSSRIGTANKTLTVAKIGARTLFTGELLEDSIIPWAAQLRAQMEKSGGEVLEHIIIDGDTETGNGANINDTDGTPAGTEAYLTLNGFRKSPLVTTAANSRSASGGLVDTDYLKTVKLMGTAGMNAMDREKVEFIVDLNTYWKSLELASVKTKDVFTNATLEGGRLTSVWGYAVRPSANMHRESDKRMTESDGTIDQTDSDNTLGAILAVRYDQWLFGYKRRFQIKLQELIDSDSTQIVAFARVGMVQRDTEASAITYNVGV